ncbi:MAG: AraC family transcriptional regulator [Clostridia bacterium]|nr:AraC family transcriptional regulator [Clostridia bacterium]
MPQINFTQGLIKYNDIRPIFAGMSQCKSLHSYGPAVRRHGIIHYCVRGKGIFRNKDGTYKIEAGQAFIINPDEITFYQADEKDPWLYIWIAFSGTVCERTKELLPVVTIKDRSIFENIRDLVNQGICCPEKYLVCLIRLFEEIIPPSPDDMPGYAFRAKDYIKLHYMEDISVEQIAESLSIDRLYLLRLFKREFGITIVNHLVRTRLNAAYDFLRAGFAVNKAATMCGYSDAYNFSKMFKKYHGISPSDVKLDRELIQKKKLGEVEEYIYCK